MPAVQMRSKAYVFTCNNYTAADELQIQSWAADHPETVQYLVYGKEIGPVSGTPHLQGYVQLQKRTSGRPIRKACPALKFLQPAHGSPAQARSYCLVLECCKPKVPAAPCAAAALNGGSPCLKGVSEIFESGSFNAAGAGARTDLESLRAAVKSGASIAELYDAESAMYRYRSSACQHRTLVLESKHRSFRPVRVFVFWGASGTGKTRRVKELDPEVYTVDHSTTTVWFCGYDGQKSILLDDFYGSIKYEYLLRLLDGHSMQVQIKGGQAYACWSNVFITSNKHPREWYSMGLTDALTRRIERCVEIKAPAGAAPIPDLNDEELEAEDINL